MRPLIREIIDRLLARHELAGRLDLNDVAEVIGTRAVGYEEVEQIIAHLEASGIGVGEALTSADVALLKRVLEAARKLKSELGRDPSVDELARETGLPVFVVRRALEHGQLAGR